MLRAGRRFAVQASLRADAAIDRHGGKGKEPIERSRLIDAGNGVVFGRHFKPTGAGLIKIGDQAKRPDSAP